MRSTSENVRRYYRTLLEAWGVQDWWPAHSRFEVIAGAFLTQNTAWSNVECALSELRRARKLSLAGIRELRVGELARLIRSSGYFRQKAKRLKNFVAFLDEHYGGSLERMFAHPTAHLRAELLELDGVGPETADSILLYGGGHPVFVVDAYTRRVLERHRLISAKAKYEEIRGLVETALAGEPAPAAAQDPEARRQKFHIHGAPAAAQVFNEYHALFVQLGKRHCLKAEAKCAGCPLEPFLERRPALVPSSKAASKAERKGPRKRRGRGYNTKHRARSRA